MNMRLSTQQVQKQILAPAMQQSIEMLMLPIMDLHMAINQELQNNPLLEVAEEQPGLEEQPQQETAPDPEEARVRLEDLLNIPDIPYAGHDGNEEDLANEKPFKCGETLEENLLHQLKFEFSDPLSVKIGEMIIGNIDEDGYLTITCEEIAEMLSIRDLSRIEAVLAAVQHFDPLGVASRDIKECLVLQARHKTNGSSDLVCRIIKEHLTEIGQKRYADIAKKLQVTLDDVKAAARMIAQLEPRPARNHRPVSPNIYIKPDVTISCDEENQYQIHINNGGVPSLRINAMYKNMVKKAGLNPQEKEFIRENLKNAVSFIRSVKQRGQTLEEICKYILQRQEGFLRNGSAELVPMTLRDVAQAVDRNESTISRAINNKYIDTPQGLFPMKFFFSCAVNAGPGSESGTAHPQATVSSRSIQEEVRHLIEEEDKDHPLSDQDIQEIFEERGWKIARRTVSKYRQNLHILPSHLRRQ